MLSAFRMLTLLLFLTSQPAFSSFYSDIFQEREDGLHVVLRGIDKNGDERTTRDIVEQDREFLRSLYCNEKNLKNYGKGGTRPESYIDDLFKWYGQQSSHGVPIGGWVIERMKDNVPMGCLYLDLNNLPGVAEIARLISPQFQGCGLGSSVMQAVVKVWAPAVKVMSQSREGFQCFIGSPLERLYVSSSPNNHSSRITQLKAGFTNMPADITYPPIDLRGRCSTFEELTLLLEKLYENTEAEVPLVKDILYRLRDHNGDTWTVSFKSSLGKIRFHFIQDVKI